MDRLHLAELHLSYSSFPGCPQVGGRVNTRKISSWFSPLSWGLMQELHVVFDHFWAPNHPKFNEFTIETYAFGLPSLGHLQISETFPISAKIVWDIVPEEKAVFSAALRGESVLFVWCSQRYLCVYAVQIYQSQWKCSKYMVCLCSKYAKINGDVLSICPLDVLSSHLEHFPMF